MAYRQREVIDGIVLCDRCGVYLGNRYTDGNTFALNRQLYCEDCRQTMLRASWAEAAKRYRKRQREENKALKTTVQKLTEYADLLEQEIIKLRRDNQ